MSSHYVPHTKIPTLVFPTSAQASRHVALMIESLIRENNSAGRPTVLGLPTGSTPVGLYRELIRLREAGLDFSRVITFNLDEYFPMPPTDPQSYRRWMQETFFDHVNIQPQNIHIPPSTPPPGGAQGHAAPATRKNPPAGAADPHGCGHRPPRPHRFQRARPAAHSRTRLVTLDPVTRRDAASSFYGEENVPQQ